MGWEELGILAPSLSSHHITPIAKHIKYAWHEIAQKIVITNIGQTYQSYLEHRTPYRIPEIYSYHWFILMKCTKCNHNYNTQAWYVHGDNGGTGRQCPKCSNGRTEKFINSEEPEIINKFRLDIALFKHKEVIDHVNDKLNNKVINQSSVRHAINTFMATWPYEHDQHS